MHNVLFVDASPMKQKKWLNDKFIHERQMRVGREEMNERK